MKEKSEETEIFPCPFCGWENIRIFEDEIKDKDHVLNGSKYTYCWCLPCGTRGPWAYSVDDDDSIVIKKCIERWNERGGRKYSNDSGQRVGSTDRNSQ